jgi:hypothetical protein
MYGARSVSLSNRAAKEGIQAEPAREHSKGGLD